MAAIVRIDQITTDNHQSEYGKILHLAFTPAEGSSEVTTKVGYTFFKSSDLNFQRHAKLLHVRERLMGDLGAFVLIVTDDSHAQIEITEQSYHLLSQAIKECSPPSDDEKKAARLAAFQASRNLN